MATRYWVGGGSSSNWNATAPTNWGTASGVQDNASVPTSVDDVIFDGAGVGGNTNSTISTTTTILSLNITTSYSATMTHNAVVIIAGNLTFTGNYTRAGASGVTISAASTITSNGVTWDLPLTFTNTNTKTLSGNLAISGLLTITGVTTFNATVSETYTASGGITINAALAGTAKGILTGGTWSGAGVLSNNFDIQGNVTISGSVNYGGANLTYISGAVTTTGSTITLSGNTTITSGAIQWWNVTHSTFSANKTLVGDMIVRGQFFNNSNGGLINKTTNEKVVIYGGLNVGSVVLDGTAPFYLSGGTWFGTSNVSVPLVIDGDITISGSVSKINTTLTYLSGRVSVSNAILNLSQTVGIRGRIDKIPFTSVLISAGSNISFDYFFSGTPSRACSVSSTGANYNISFTDGFEKMARNVAISGATLARPGQLIVATNPRFNTNRSSNVGIRYVNQSPNGAPKGAPSITDTMTAPALGLVSDPCFVRQ